MTRRKIERLEGAAGTGRTHWATSMQTGQRLALQAGEESAEGKARHAEAVRRIFRDFWQMYRPGMTPAQQAQAADKTLDALKEALPPNVYVLTLAMLRYG